MTPPARSILSLAGAALSALALGSCQAPVHADIPAVPGAPTFTLEATRIVDDVVNKGTRNWHDSMLAFPALRERLRAKAAANYALQAPSVAWSWSVGSATSSVPAFSKDSPWYAGPTPHANDRLWVITDGGTLNKIIPTSDPGTTPPTTKTGLGTFSKTAVLVSGDNRRIYLFSTTGTFTIVDAATLTVLYSQPISQSGFTGMAPFLDYGTPTVGGGNFGNVENLYVVSTDGSIYRIAINHVSTLSVTVNAHPAGSGTDIGSVKAAWASPYYAIPYGVGITAASFPFAWKQRVYFGTTLGQYYLVNLTTPTAPAQNKYDLAKYTSATGTARAITAPGAFDVDNNLDINALFVPCGDRLVWVNPQTGAEAASPALTLDRVPPAGNAGLLSAYTPGTIVNKVYNSTDWVSVKRNQFPVPSRWGGSSFSTAATGVASTSVRRATNGDIWITDYANDRVRVFRAAGTTATIAVGNEPNKLEFDGNGFLWVSGDGLGSATQGWVTKINTATATIVAGFPVNVAGAVFIAPENNGGSCYVSCNQTNRVHKLLANGTSAGGSFPITVTGTGTIFCDRATPNNNVWAQIYGTNTIKRYQSTGAAMAAGGTLTVGTAGTSNPYAIAFDYAPATPEAFVTLNGNSRIAVLNATTGATIRTMTTSAFPAAIRFDNAGNLYTTNTEIFATSIQQLNRVNRTTGAVLQTYSMASYGNPYEVVFDAGDTGWVSCSNASFTTGSLVNVTELGNLGDVFGSAYRASVGDGDDSYGYLKFKIAKDNFAAQAPYQAKLALTPEANGSNQAVELYTASNFLSTGTLWVGYPGAVNADYNNRPTVSATAFDTKTGIAIVKDAASTKWDVPMPSDQLNTVGDASNAVYSFAMRTTDQLLKNSAHWYSTTTAGATMARYPRLEVDLVGGGIGYPTTSIQCQPTLDSMTHKVWIASCNALFELDYSNTNNFQATDMTYYNLTQGGRTFGPVTAVPKKFIYPAGNVLYTYNGRLVVPDFNTSANNVLLNNYLASDPPSSAARLKYNIDVTPGAITGPLRQQMLYDYDLGHVYVVTASNHVVRVKILE